MVTATTATTRTAINKFGALSHTVVYHATSPSLLVLVQMRDSADRDFRTVTLELTQTSAQKIVYGDDGGPTVSTDTAMTGRAVGAFNAYNNAAGNAVQKGAALDAYLQTNGIFPT